MFQLRVSSSVRRRAAAGEHARVFWQAWLKFRVRWGMQVLRDYVLVMVGNKKSHSQICSDLETFFGET